MAKTKISEFSATPANNTDIDSINIAEGCAPSGINDAIRELMAQLKDFQTGAAGDSFNGPVGTTTAAAGAFTTLAASGAVTLSGGIANGVPYLNGSKVLTTGSALTFDGTKLSTPASGSISADFGGIQLGGNGTDISGTVAGLAFKAVGANPIQFFIGDSERMRVDSSGNLLVGTATRRDGARITCETSENGLSVYVVPNTNAVDFAVFRANAGVLCGNISRVGTTNAVTYASASDYRLKENIAPMTGALAAVARLKPVTYTWKDSGTVADGFIAHELAEVCPSAVVGEKDAVDADGNPKYQSIDASFLVATLTAAIQEQQAIITALTARVAALEAA